MLTKGMLLYALIGLNLSLLGAFIFKQLFKKSSLVILEEKLRQKHGTNFDEIYPTFSFLKDESVSVSFRHVKDRKNEKLQRCITPNSTGVKEKIIAMKACLQLFKEVVPNPKSENLKLIKNVPGMVARFGEASVVSSSYPFAEVDWKKLYQTTFKSANLLHKVGFYKRKLKPKHYDYFPDKEPDFNEPHLGIVNVNDYCNVHDLLILNDSDLALKKKYFITDYHQFSFVRMFVMNKIGQDLMPKIGKNMSKLNYLQKLDPFDLRANMFFFKKPSVHYHHKIGEHFTCFGQSYNHIPGHGGAIRKDMLNKASQEWMSLFESYPNCKNQLDFFLDGYRLHIQNECKAFFKVLKSSEYNLKKRQLSPIQFIIKVGYGVHRGAGVQLLNELLEKEIIAQYEDGAKCGVITDNVVAQKYIDDPILYEGHKFDFRIYMMISSVNPLKIYYHDGFLRLSLFKYFKNSTIIASQITNTELSKNFIKNLDAENKTHNGKTPEELREFQMKTLDEISEYLYNNGKVKSKKWADEYLRKQFQTAFISIGKMLQKNLYKSSDVYEMFGVDFLMDSDFKLYVLEVNASPMIIGTNKRKMDLMDKMMRDFFNITFAQQFSRTSSGIEYLKTNKDKIINANSATELKTIQEEFNKLYVNVVKDEYKHMLENNSWKMVYDDSLSMPEKYFGMITDDCAAIVENATKKESEKNKK